MSLYPTIESKAARLAFGLVKNHPFIDGNKRIGILVMLSFLEANGMKIICTDEELVALGLGLAEGSADEKTMLTFIVEHIYILNISCSNRGKLCCIVNN